MASTQRTRSERDKSFATFAAAWTAGFIARREGVTDEGPEDREVFQARMMADYGKWCGPLGKPPVLDSMIDAAMNAYCGDRQGAPGQRAAMHVALCAALHQGAHGV